MVLEKLKQSIPKKQKGQYLVALDIGTEYVKVLIGKVVGEGEDRKMEVIGVGRQHQGLTDMHTGAIADIAGVVDNCDEALNQAEEMAGVQAQDCVIGIAGELVRGETLSAKFNRSNSEESLEQEELEKIIAQVQTRALKRAKLQTSQDSGSDSIDVKLVNAAIVNLHIDGYRVNNPIGFQGSEVLIQMFMAFAPMVHIGALERAAYELDLNLVNVAAEPFAVAKSIGTQDAETFSAVFIDVGGGTTDIAIVNEGGVEGAKMFGIGGRSFTQAIVRKLGVSYEEAEKLKLEFSNGKLDKEDQETVKAALMPVLKVWLSGVDLALSEFKNIEQLPSKILLCGGGTGLPYIPQALKSKAWRKSLPFPAEVKVEHIMPKQVERVFDSTGKIDDYTYITPMGLLNLGLDAMHNEDTKTHIMRRLNQAMQV